MSSPLSPPRPWPPRGSVPQPPDHGYPLGRIGGRRPQIRVTVPLGVLLPEAPTPHRRDDDPAGVWDPLAHAIDPAQVAELDGYGPLTPAVARALALGGTWTGLVTDPASPISSAPETARASAPAAACPPAPATSTTAWPTTSAAPRPRRISARSARPTTG